MVGSWRRSRLESPLCPRHNPLEYQETLDKFAEKREEKRPASRGTYFIAFEAG